MTIPTDAPVPSETRLFRRVRPSQGRQHLVFDHNRNCVRPSSALFGQERTSILLGDCLEEQGREPESVLDDFPEDFLVAVSAELAFALKQVIERTPTNTELAHGEIVGKKTGKVKNAFIRNLVWLKQPEDLCADLDHNASD